MQKQGRDESLQKHYPNKKEIQKGRNRRQPYVNPRSHYMYVCVYRIAIYCLIFIIVLC